MILFYFGNDFEKRHQKIKNVLENVKEKRPDANFFHYDSFDINIENLKELVISQGLFETKDIVLLTNLFLNLDLKEFVLNNLEEFKNSDSAFIFSEEKITPIEAKKIKEFSTKFEEFKKSETRPENLFGISDFLQKKDKKNLWTFYQENIQKGTDADSLYNIIFWSMKALALAEKFSEEESGLKPFPYKKAKKYLKVH